MSVLLVRIDPELGGADLAVRGYAVERTDEGWDEDLRAPAEFPREQAVFDVARASVLTAGDAGLAPADVGAELWRLVLGGPVGDWWRAETRDAAPHTVRTILDVRVDDLKHVPWELMAADGRNPVFCDPDLPWVRARTPWQDLDDIPAPLTVLAVVSDEDDADLGADEELAAIYGALRTVPAVWNVEVLVQPRLAELRQKLADLRPEVLHLVGHGQQYRGEQVLAMRNPGGGQWPLRRRDVDAFPGPFPRLVVLNACRSANAAAGQESAWTFSDAFVDRGAAAVVTMQGDIPSAAAARFARSLYAELAAGSAVDVATARARTAVYEHLADTDPSDERSWALPVLSVAADPDHVLPVRLSVAARERLAGERRPPFGQVPRYVDRFAERRQVWQALDPEPGREPSRVVLVSGQKEVGKSAVVASAALTLQYRGRRVAYVDLSATAGDRPATWLTVLRRVRDAIWYWDPETPVELRQRFDHELWYLRQYREPAPWTPESSRSDDGAEFPSVGDHYDEWAERILARFRRLLRKAAGEGSLVVVLDGLSGAYLPDLRRWLVPHLLAATDTAPAVSWVVVGTDGQLDGVRDELGETTTALVRVDPVKTGELLRLAREYYARGDVSLEDADWWPSARELIAIRAATAGWGLVKLVSMLDLVAESSP